jgi:hypothetical protein
MSSGRHFILLLLFAAAAAAFAWFAPIHYPQYITSTTLGVIAGGFIFMCGALFVMVLRQRATVRQCADIMSQMNEAVGLVIADQRRVEEQLLNIQGALSTLEAEPTRDVGEVVAEVKVLQSLIGQLYEARGTTSAPAIPAAPPTLRVVDNPNAQRREALGRETLGSLSSACRNGSAASSSAIRGSRRPTARSWCRNNISTSPSGSAWSPRSTTCCCSAASSCCASSGRRTRMSASS